MTSKSKFVCLTITVLFTCIWSALTQSTDRPKRGGGAVYNAEEYNEDDESYIKQPYSISPRTTTVVSTFDCATMPYRPGMFADVHVGCQHYHVCEATSTGSGSTFQCPGGTSFNQKHLVCDWTYNVNCDETHHHFVQNKKLYVDVKRDDVGKDRPTSIDFFTALFEAKRNAVIAATHATRAQHAAQLAHEAAHVKHVITTQQINDIRANADALANAARRAAQMAAHGANARVHAAQRAASESVLASRATVDRAIDGATALRATANVKLVVAQAAAKAISEANMSRLHSSYLRKQRHLRKREKQLPHG